jgi:crotonobetaine/carnitine-CoA ligase
VPCGCCPSGGRRSANDFETPNPSGDDIPPFERRFGVAVFEWYGAVEGGLAFRPPGVGPVGSFGRPVPGLDMRIVDERDVECPPGVVCEIVSRPPTGEAAEVEYFGNAEASRKKTAGGWLRSGDLGHRDADGWLYFDYRKGGGIRHNGDFVNAGFVEKVIAEHPAVSDVFVYGVPAASGAPGEKDVVAAIVPAPGVPFDPRGRPEWATLEEFARLRIQGRGGDHGAAGPPEVGATDGGGCGGGASQ